MEGSMGELLTADWEAFTGDQVVEGLIGKAPAFREVLARLPTVAQSEAPVLITGETGTGKELVARAVHALSARAQSSFVAVNCGALMDTLLESELFGHERGAFTDAHARRPGLISEAARGTLFLDELDTLTPRAQVALLRFLQDRRYRALGSTVEQRADVRFVAATNARLEGLVRAGAFRADLYYRVSVFAVNLPSLRERQEDIVPLAEHFIGKYGGRMAAAPVLTAQSEAALLACEWPGNVRELESAIVRALPMAQGGRIEPRDLGLPGWPGEASAAMATDPAERTGSYKAQKRRMVEAFERQYLTQLMTEQGGNVSRAARAAGKERRDLGKLLKRYGFASGQFAARC